MTTDITIKLHNTKSRKKEDFVPLDPKNVRMYVCGPTVYDRAHLGNARPVIVFDVLYRLLRHVYGADHVTYVRNFTDVDDKINATALARQEAGAKGSLEDLIAERTEETIDWYLADMGAVGALRPTVEPRATKFIGKMQEMIEELVDKGFAYTVAAKLGHNSKAQYVFLDSERVPAHAFLSVEAFDTQAKGYRYGELSGRTADEMIAGSRAEVGEGKRNPMDSVLWKPSTVEQPGWESKWGFGRPGWHIECSAMARELLGKTFDIHGGGLDLMFPHHENELAQCRACDGADASAQYWMHNEMLQVEGKKMSKSLGNFFTVRDLLEQGVPGEVIRFVMLSTHYRKPMDWTEKKAGEAEKTLNRWSHIKRFVKYNSLFDGEPDHEVIAAVSSDLNTPLALARLHELAKTAIRPDAEAAAVFFATMQLLGFDNLPDRIDFDFNESGVRTDTIGKFSKLMSYRWQAREEKRYQIADTIRHALEAVGVNIKDTSPNSVEEEFTSEFDKEAFDRLFDDVDQMMKALK